MLPAVCRIDNRGPPGPKNWFSGSFLGRVILIRHVIADWSGNGFGLNDSAALTYFRYTFFDCSGRGYAADLFRIDGVLG